MTEKSNGKTLSDLMDFLDYAARKGLMKPATTQSWKAACKQVLGILENTECSDLSMIELDNVFVRFQNKNAQNFSPSSLQTYRSRVKKAISEFLSYKENPSKWEPSLAQRSTRLTKNKSQTENSDEPEQNTTELKLNDNTGEKNGLTYKFPLREGITINISGVPRDLKILEAKRIGAFLSTLCEDFKPGEF